MRRVNRRRKRRRRRRRRRMVTGARQVPSHPNLAEALVRLLETEKNPGEKAADRVIAYT
jgi:hypothetical protein